MWRAGLYRVRSGASICVLLGCLCDSLPIVMAEETNACLISNAQGAIFVLNEENDWVASTDRH